MDAVCSVCVKKNGFDNSECWSCMYHYDRLEEQIIISAVSGMKSTDWTTASPIVQSAVRIVRELKEYRCVEEE